MLITSMSKYQSVRGTRDLLPALKKTFRAIEAKAYGAAQNYGFKEIETPIFEFSDVFHRSLGETSDAVSKETYTFTDRGGESITLRPEGTAGVVRAYVSEGLAQHNPNKLYYAFKELVTKADKQDDLLLQDFKTLLPIDTEHIETIPDAEKEVKYNYLIQWIRETAAAIEQLDPDKMSAGISYLLLNLAYRIDFLIVPESRLLYDLEDLVAVFFMKDDKPASEKNKMMLQGFLKMMPKTKEDVFPCLFRSKHSFAITQPTQQKIIADSIFGANQNTVWFKENNHPYVAQQISEYGLGYCQYNFSLPKPVSDLYLILMKVSYADFFRDLGFSEELYNSKTQQFNSELIGQEITGIMDAWREKYPQINFKTENLKYDSLLSFTLSFTAEIEFVNTEVK